MLPRRPTEVVAMIACLPLQNILLIACAIQMFEEKSMTTQKDEMVLVETRDRVGLITLSRPQALNALCIQLTTELAAALDELEADDSIGAIVVTGSHKAFAAGADIKELAGLDYVGAYASDFIGVTWERLARCRKPTIAAVAGYALGGGCELAMMADFILAADNAKFGQPEIGIGTIPGAGGTQRLTRAIGKSKAMDMLLSGRTMDAAEAERAGLVSRVIPLEGFIDEAVNVASTIAGRSQPVLSMLKDVTNAAFETSLAEGIRVERRMFYSTFSLEDRREGMEAFREKRTPSWKHR